MHAYATALSDDNEHEIPFVSSDSYVSTGNNSNWTAAVTGGAANPVFGSSANTAGIIYHKVNNTDFAAGDDFSVAYSVYIGPSIVAGTYSGTAVYNPSINVDEDDPVTTNYAITYDANGGDESSVPAVQSTTGSSTTALATIAAGTPTHEIGTFLGWSTTPNNSNGRLFKPGDKITVTNPNTTLYAIWRLNVIPLTGNFQNLTTTACDDATTYTSNYSVETTYSLTDTRDSKEYLVRKLKDGNCWMTQNLAIGYDEETSIETWDWDAKATGSYNLPASSTDGFSNDTIAYVYKGSHTDATANSASNTGAYYSYLAATAGAGTGDSGEVTTSICPKGWRLPSKDMFVNLAKAYGGTGENGDTAIKYGSNFSDAYSAALLGQYYNSLLYFSGSGGYWLSSTIYDSTRWHDLYLNDSYGRPQDNTSKILGFSVRCVFSGQ